MFDLISVLGDWSQIAFGAALLALATLIFIAAGMLDVSSGTRSVGAVSRIARFVASAGMALGVIFVSASLAKMFVGLVVTSLWWIILLIPFLPLLFVAFITLFFDNCFTSRGKTARAVFAEMMFWTPAAVFSLVVIGVALALVALTFFALAGLLVSIPVAGDGRELIIVLSVFAAVILLALTCLIAAAE